MHGGAGAGGGEWDRTRRSGLHIRENVLGVQTAVLCWGHHRLSLLKGRQPPPCGWAPVRLKAGQRPVVLNWDTPHHRGHVEMGGNGVLVVSWTGGLYWLNVLKYMDMMMNFLVSNANVTLKKILPMFRHAPGSSTPWEAGWRCVWFDRQISERKIKSLHKPRSGWRPLVFSSMVRLV